MTPPAEAMSGVHWWPVGTASRVAAAVGQLTPSGELRTKTFDCPLASSAFQTTCTPLASAATAGAELNREKVSPLGHANGPSPQSEAPFRSEEHTSELQSRPHLVCRLLLEKKKQIY